MPPAAPFQAQGMDTVPATVLHYVVQRYMIHVGDFYQDLAYSTAASQLLAATRSASAHQLTTRHGSCSRPALIRTCSYIRHSRETRPQRLLA